MKTHQSQSSHHVQQRNPWSWIPSLYFMEGLPYIIVMTVSVIMYKRMGVSNTDIALYTSWLYLPWVLKFLWSPVVDLLKTKRYWIVTMQVIIGAGLGSLALTLPLPSFFKWSLLLFWLLAFSSATQDIAIDGFYMLGLSDHDQAWFVGIRSIFYRLAMLTGQGLLIIFVGYLEAHTGLPEVSVEISSTKGSERARWHHPDSIQFDITAPDDNGVLIQPPHAAIPMTLLEQSYKDSLLELARQWNIRHGFIQSGTDDPSQYTKAGASSHEDDNALKRWLKKHFPKKTPSTPGQYSGNIGLLYFRLAQPPASNETVIFHFGQQSGDASISLVPKPWAGEKFIFNNQNWQIPAVAIIQLDSKLQHQTSATFVGRSGNIPLSWSIAFGALAILFLLFGLYHWRILPFPKKDQPHDPGHLTEFIREFLDTFKSFFTKRNIIAALLFLLLYRLAESQLVKLAAPFLLDTREAGGLALTTGQVGFVYGTIGLSGLIIGGVIGGILAAHHGLRFWLWPMAIAINLPNIVYVYLSLALPHQFWIINLCVFVEQFGYGFGFTAFMLYMIYISQGAHQTAHFAIATAFMALGMMIPGMFSGWLQEIIGYPHFFVWVMLSTAPSFTILFFLRIAPEFGRKRDKPAR